ncbi:helix-turn-helix domain-containing protein [Lutibacter sp.]|uniref:helix-turn-helix domain-containing protein n=1 Tax=Lutibacter sp. TaxID=1925666 RepID=UPI001A339080|nr:helix-turn-helix domain-containing protein [Lutibacter sp.]MBI9041684.1 helix-turn-helix domain-containing protein [Lutibacter sp.]
MNKIILTTSEELKTLLEMSVSAQMESLKILIEENLKPTKSNLTVKEVAKKLNVTELTVHNYIKKGFIKAEKIGRRIVINCDDLENSLSEVKSLKYRR